MFKIVRNSEREPTVAICTELVEAQEILKYLNATDPVRYRLVGMDESDVSSALFALAKWMPGAMRKI